MQKRIFNFIFKIVIVLLFAYIISLTFQSNITRFSITLNKHGLIIESEYYNNDIHE